MRYVLLLLVVLLVAIPVTGILLFVRPPTGDVGDVDAVAVFAGGSGERLRAAQRLMDDGAGSVLVISYGPSRLCSGEARYEVICFVPEPSTTSGEAAEIGRLAEERGWESVAVVTSTHHVARARVATRQCTDAEVRMVDAGSAVPSNEVRLRLIRHEIQGLIATLVLNPACPRGSSVD
jgi:uncharacterized SAM-binding protein YcdF (DUF218 family)